MALKAVDIIKVDDNTSALRANVGNKIQSFENDPMPLPY